MAVPPVKLTTVANRPGFPGCRPTDMERSARRRDFSRIVIHLPSATQNSPGCQIFFSDYSLGNSISCSNANVRVWCVVGLFSDRVVQRASVVVAEVSGRLQLAQTSPQVPRVLAVQLRQRLDQSPAGLMLRDA